MNRFRVILGEGLDPDPGRPPGPHQSWMDQAACIGLDPDLFFPQTSRGILSGQEAREVCARCEVRTDCLEHALANNEQFGIWGGMSERQRRTEARRRRIAARNAELGTIRPVAPTTGDIA